MPRESTNQLPRNAPLVLVDLLAHASSAARIVGHLEDSDDSNIEQLSDHVDALVHGLTELLGEHRLTAEVAPDDDGTDVVGELRQLTSDEPFKRIARCSKGYVRGDAS
jgi:hypothetical protein